MAFRDLPPIDTDAELRLQKLKLGESVFELFDDVEHGTDFEYEQSTHSFTDEAFIRGTWLPIEIESILLHEGTSVRAIDVSYDVDTSRPTPMVALKLYFLNGEQLLISKNPQNLRISGFETSYSDPSSEIPEIANEDVGKLLISLLFAQADKPDAVFAGMLASPNAKQTMNPTDPVVSQYIRRLLDSRSDTWQKEQAASYDFEDDRNKIRLVKTTHSNGNVGRSVYFTQYGSEAAPDIQFELNANIMHADDGALLSSSLDYEKSDIDSAFVESGSADEMSGFYDFMLAAITNIKSYMKAPSVEASFEQNLEAIEHLDFKRGNYDN